MIAPGPPSARWGNPDILPIRRLSAPTDVQLCRCYRGRRGAWSSGARSGSRREKFADALVGSRMGCQKPLPPSAGRTTAVIRCAKGGGQLQREAVLGSEAVGGQLAPPG